MFASLDVDVDGYLSAEIVRVGFARMGLPASYARRVIEAADSKQDGKISFAAMRMFGAPKLHFLHHSCTNFGGNEDDNIESNALHEVLRKFQLEMMEKDTELLLPKIEDDGDGSTYVAGNFEHVQPIAFLRQFYKIVPTFDLRSESRFVATRLKLIQNQQIIGGHENKSLVQMSALYELFSRLSAGGIAAVVAQLCCQPIETVKVRLQNEANLGNAKKYKSFSNGAMVVVAEEGLARGLWKGMLPSAMRELSYSSLRFGLYQPIKKILGAQNPRDTPFWFVFFFPLIIIVTA